MQPLCTHPSNDRPILAVLSVFPAFFLQVCQLSIAEATLFSREYDIAFRTLGWGDQREYTTP